jgi:hypothetical protein
MYCRLAMFRPIRISPATGSFIRITRDERSHTIRHVCCCFHELQPYARASWVLMRIGIRPIP